MFVSRLFESCFTVLPEREQTEPSKRPGALLLLVLPGIIIDQNYLPNAPLGSPSRFTDCLFLFICLCCFNL